MTTATDLLIELAASIPLLPGAACKGRAATFDKAADRTGLPGQRAQTEARRICRACPCKVACRTWFDRLPESDRPLGIVAGRLHSRNRATHPNMARA